jgi:FkbM family methyltransferase
MPLLKHIGSLEHGAIRLVFRLFLGKKKLHWLTKKGIMNIDRLVGKTFVNRYTGFIRPLNKNEYLTFFDGFWLVTSYNDTFIINEVKNVYLKPSKDNVVIDVGAHYGFYTLYASRLVGANGLIIALEPASENYKRLTANLELNKIKNVKAFNIGLADFEGKAKLYLSKRDGCEHSIIIQMSEDFEYVPVKTLDNFVCDLRLTKINLIKLDTEGAELRILMGAISTIQKHKPKLTIAAYHSPTESKEIIKWLTEKAPFYCILKVITNNNVFVHAYTG